MFCPVDLEFELEFIERERVANGDEDQTSGGAHKKREEDEEMDAKADEEDEETEAKADEEDDETDV